MAEIEHRTVSANGIDIHIAEAGEGPLVLLCHGFPELWYSWRHQMPALADAGYRVVAPDQRGYGGTDSPEAVDAYTEFHLVGDMVGLVSALGESRAAIVGHDWGAPVAWSAALWRPDVFGAVAALSVPVSARPPMSPIDSMTKMFGDRFFYMLYFQDVGVAEHELEHDVRTTMRKMFFGASGDAAPDGSAYANPPPRTAYFLDQLEDTEKLPDWLTEEDLDYFVDAFTRNGFRGPLNWYRCLDRSWELSAPFQGQKIEQPALFLGGDRDAYSDSRMEENMREVAVNLVDVVMLPGVGHWVQQEAPEETNSTLLAFLGDVWPTGASRR